MRTSRGPGRVTLPRALSKLGLASRAQATRLIEDGLVSVNRTIEKNPHRWIDIAHDRIELKNRVVERQALRYIVLNKPLGFVTTRSDERGQRTVFEILGDAGKGLSAVGRLDKDTSGLLLFTNDHQLANLLTSPESNLLKTYIASLQHSIDGKDLLRLADGIEIEVGGAVHLTKPARVARSAPDRVEISITEGKNRQIRRMMSALGNEVISLQRISLGPLTLGDLAEGQFRNLTAEEVKILKGAVQLPRTNTKARNGRRP